MRCLLFGSGRVLWVDLLFAGSSRDCLYRLLKFIAVPAIHVILVGAISCTPRRFALIERVESRPSAPKN